MISGMKGDTFVKTMVDIEVVIDKKYIDPKVMVLTKEKNQQVENIIYAI